MQIAILALKEPNGGITRDKCNLAMVVRLLKRWIYKPRRKDRNEQAS